MQTLEVISVNLWQILISLCNLLLLFFIFKIFLYKPIKKTIAARQAALDEQYQAASEAKEDALLQKQRWEDKMQNAQQDADHLLKKAVTNAECRSDQILSDAKEKADGIIRQAGIEAKLERKKAEASIKQEIIDISSCLTEKMLEREIRTEDHRELIDSFIEKIGEDAEK